MYPRLILFVVLNMLLKIRAVPTTETSPLLDRSPNNDRTPIFELEIGKEYTTEEIQELQKRHALATAEMDPANTLQERGLEKREILHRTLNAKFNFYCPNLRNNPREFEWVVYWYSASNRMEAVGLKDIDGFRNFSFDTNNGKFAGYWYHSFCLHTGNKICTYNVQAFFEGKKYTHLIIMDMVTDASNGANILAPYVTENCVDLHSNSCPAVGSTHCTITSINLTSP